MYLFLGTQIQLQPSAMMANVFSDSSCAICSLHRNLSHLAEHEQRSDRWLLRHHPSPRLWWVGVCLVRGVISVASSTSRLQARVGTDCSTSCPAGEGG